MANERNCIEHPTVINNVEYTLQSRTVELDDGMRHQEYRVLLNGDEIKSWTRGDILPYFGLKQD
ncbi:MULTISPECIES: hypothetical protein [unclassified Herbaspirillum]|uniref:hypothetical protein n=1 Tax=unclassified Herbaspirillum TaxID=2624150 RepID=UPI00114F0FE9|nr:MULTISPECIES: hypothetical protein [unclassified Herbaspirillum]MBB5392856.1 hypothetical protein [Herbaspirillum sp. SJZ102]TQK04498.1 hypothetical protein FB599_3053 [Herbaspirillum sp. SJZ130]TQK09717.1 hypothetical protein FB598_2709 [Herbaspirillum sp. SJZ106]TWC65933.1 hypothetical protein FB597_106242 [Herbaspirillum sp. SJZ099]